MGRIATTTPTRTGAPPWQVWLALGTLYLVWGSTYLAIKVAIETLPSLLHAGVRFVIAGLTVIAVLAVRRRSALSVTRVQLATVAAVGGLLLLGGNGLVVVGEEGLASGLAALIIAAVPLWIVLLRALGGDRPAAATVGGVALGFAGVAVLLRPGGGGHSSVGHAAIVLLASLSWSAGSYLATRAPMPVNPFTATGLEMLFGGGALVVAGLLRGELSGFSVSAVSGPLMAFTAYVWLLGNAPVSQVATYAYVNPAVAVVLGALVLGEQISLQTIVGGAIILLAVAVVVAQESRRRADAD